MLEKFNYDAVAAVLSEQVFTLKEEEHNEQDEHNVAPSLQANKNYSLHFKIIDSSFNHIISYFFKGEEPTEQTEDLNGKTTFNKKQK